MRSHRVLVVLLALVAAFAVVGALVANSRQITVDPSSPEGVVQSYLRAVIDGDGPRAVEYLEPQSKCTADDFTRYQVTNISEVRLVESDINGSDAKVAVDLEMGGNGLMGDVWRDRQNFALKNIDGQWRISGTPWPMFECGGFLK